MNFSFKIMLAAEIALGNRKFVDINQVDMETRRVDSTTPKDAMLPQNSPFNDLESLVAIQTETPQITRTQMLPENSPFNILEGLVEIQPETPKLRKYRCFLGLPFNELEDRKLFWIIADSIQPKEVMLFEMNPETPKITRTQILPENS